MNKQEVQALMQTVPTVYVKGVSHGWAMLSKWLMPKEREVKAVVIGVQVWADLLVDPDFMKVFEPSSSVDAMTIGVMGHFVDGPQMEGTPLLCEGYFHPEEHTFGRSTAMFVYSDGTAAICPFAPIQKPTGVRKMYATDPGHVYQLADGQTVRFIKKVKNEETGAFDTVHVGTTNEEMLEMLIDRTIGLNAKLNSPENAVAIHHMEAALEVFNARTRARQKQGVEATPLPHVSEPMGDPVGLSHIGSHDGTAFRKTEQNSAGSTHAAFTKEMLAERGQTLEPRAAWPFPGTKTTDNLTGETSVAGDNPSHPAHD